MGRFGDAWFFSMQALSTIGFGSLSPATTVTNIVTNVEACFGIFLIAIINGVVWGKFVTIGQASAVFSRHAVMMLPEDDEKSNGEEGAPELVFRIANNQRGQSLVHVKVQAFAVLPAFSPGGSRILRQEPLELDRAYYPMLVVNGEVRHRVDRSSPLFGMTAHDIKVKNVCVHVVIEGVETLFKRDFFAAHLYRPEALKWAHRLTEFMFVSPSCGFVLDMTHFHDVEPQFADEEQVGAAEEAENAQAVALRLSLLPDTVTAVGLEKEAEDAQHNLLGSIGERSDSSIGAGGGVANPTTIAMSSSVATI
jgi:inward rectifier potassium channel